MHEEDEDYNGYDRNESEEEGGMLTGILFCQKRRHKIPAPSVAW